MPDQQERHSSVRLALVRLAILQSVAVLILSFPEAAYAGTCGTPQPCCFPAWGPIPGCENSACCSDVCAVDPWCCDFEWDGPCASQACETPSCNCGCFPDCNNNGTPDEQEPDFDDDGVIDDCDNCPLTPNPQQLDCQPNGTGDVCEIDGGAPDCNGNDVPDDCDLAGGLNDCNGNGEPDECETDTDDDGVIDDCDNCELYNPDQEDCDSNDVGDICDLADNLYDDCNENFIPDDCEIADGSSDDDDEDGVPDECQVDTDGDGLYDYWETRGVPYDRADGTIGRVVLDEDGDGQSDAVVGRKDLFVEVDRMDCSESLLPEFGDQEQGLVKLAFENAPIDFPIGIVLHIRVDPPAIPCEENTLVPVDGSGHARFPLDAAFYKQLNFGDWQEAPEDRESYQAARRKAFRYCLIYRKFLREDNMASAYGGLGQLGGDDFVISPPFCYTCTNGYGPENYAAVFMHELGHNLGLRHGGGDSKNGKPNYPSIMNYTCAYKKDWNRRFWRLDFCREVLPPLYESNLDETVSIGASSTYSNYWMPYYGLVSDDGGCYDTTGDGMPKPPGAPVVWHASLDPAKLTDFDFDCFTDNESVASDLNYLSNAALPGMLQPSPGEVLLGWNDWETVLQNMEVKPCGAFFSAFCENEFILPTDELTEDQVQFMEENFPLSPGTSIPAASEWGVAVMALLMLTAGSIVWMKR